MDKVIIRSEDFDLTGEDIHRITKGKAVIMSYSDLEHVNNLYEVLRPTGVLVLLYETRQNFGHWVCLIDRGAGHLEFFDPYGLQIDEELKLSKFNLRQHNGEIVPHLSALVDKGRYVVQSNLIRLQKFLEHVNTCGRWVSVRIIYKDKPISEFVRLMTSNKHYDGDFWVSALTILA